MSLVAVMATRETKKNINDFIRRKCIVELRVVSCLNLHREEFERGAINGVRELFSYL